jgi:hypothetical protein
MDVLTQALNVVARARAGSGRVTLTLDLAEPAQRAAYAAALAVLEVNGIEADAVVRPADDAAEAAGGDVTGAAVSARSGAGAPADDSNAAGDLTGHDAELRRAYGEALAELTPDEARQAAALAATFPRVRELLRDGANVTAVAQIQYRRWVDEHRDAVRES